MIIEGFCKIDPKSLGSLEELLIVDEIILPKKGNSPAPKTSLCEDKIC